MGLVLDSEVLIAAEREFGEAEIVLSSISVLELEHGLHRARTAEQARRRREYLDAVFAVIPVEPFTMMMAQLAARTDAEARRTGQTIPFADLLIGATARYFGYAVATRNRRHFQMIPNLRLVQLLRSLPASSPFPEGSFKLRAYARLHFRRPIRPKA